MKRGRKGREEWGIYYRIGYFGRIWLQLFRDIDSIPLGVDFPDRIAAVLRECFAVLVVIGPGWLEARSPDGRRRLDDPQDHVRVEVECALRAVNTRVIHVLVRDASMPKLEEVPESLRTLEANRDEGSAQS